ncbi:MAG: 2-amino-4-hydroxy-6-hydroxymethyldihydropteridine diphosphokinase [Acidimicrobiia bacterium]|nr:2-amino-4-hydroxy-6-hydroxymethyldihydropteridine diphosphokinase [Acidimicrobiia bacterium]
MGDRRDHLAAAVTSLSRLGKIVAVSPLYETDPVGGPAQGPYLNAVVVMDTALSPGALLEECLAIERSRGRERRERWGPRTLDLDLLICGDELVDRPGLTVPHPGLGSRRFVLQPLVDAWPEARLPDGTRPIDLLPGVMDQRVTRLPGERWWISAPDPSVLEEPPPEVSPGEAAAIALGLYGIEGEAFPLEGERDRNFLVDSDRGRFSLKVANPAQDPALLDMQQAALEHLALADPDLPVPRAVLTSAGGRVGFTERADAVVPVRMQTFLEGARMPDGYSTPASRRSLAGLLARLDGALAAFSHPSGTHDYLWDLTLLSALRDRVGHLPEDRGAVVLEQIDRFEHRVVPALVPMRRQMIHSDANPANLLVDPGDPDRVTGIVDFGDLVVGPLVADVAIAAAYQCLAQADPAAVAGDLVAAYHHHLPLTPDEIAVVPGLVAGRLVQSLVISSWRAELHPGNRDYILVHAEPGWAALQRLALLGDDWLSAEGLG